VLKLSWALHQYSNNIRLTYFSPTICPYWPLFSWEIWCLQRTCGKSPQLRHHSRSHICSLDGCVSVCPRY